MTEVVIDHTQTDTIIIRQINYKETNGFTFKLQVLDESVDDTLELLKRLSIFEEHYSLIMKGSKLVPVVKS